MSRKPHQGLRMDGVIYVRVKGFVNRLERCGMCAAAPGTCDKSGCDGRHEPGWRRVQPEPGP